MSARVATPRWRLKTFRLKSYSRELREKNKARLAQAITGIPETEMAAVGTKSVKSVCIVCFKQLSFAWVTEVRFPKQGRFHLAKSAQMQLTSRVSTTPAMPAPVSSDV